MIDEIDVKRVTADAQLPTRSYGDDAGLDLYARESVIIEPGSWNHVPTGVAVAIPSGYGGFVWPRSGLSVNEGIDVLGGVIDPQYHREIDVILALHNHADAYRVDEGERIAQLVIQPVELPAVREVNLLSQTSRGGFGSTGA